MSDAHNNLYAVLDTSRAEIEALIATLDPETVVYPDSKWRIKDVITVITAWEEEATYSLRAFHKKKKHYIEERPGDYNARQIVRRKDFAMERVLADWAEVRGWLKEALAEIPVPKLKYVITYPWGEEGTITRLVEAMVKREGEYRAAIAKATRGDEE